MFSKYDPGVVMAFTSKMLSGSWNDISHSAERNSVQFQWEYHWLMSWWSTTSETRTNTPIRRSGSVCSSLKVNESVGRSQYSTIELLEIFLPLHFLLRYSLHASWSDQYW